MNLLERLRAVFRAPPPAPPRLVPAWPWTSGRCRCGRCVDAAGDPIILCLRCGQDLGHCRCRARARA